MKNIDTFNEVVGWVLTQLYSTHPVRVDLKLSNIPDSLLKAIYETEQPLNAFWGHSVTFLKDNGFIVYTSQTMETDFYNVGLTMLGLTVLNAVPESLEVQQTVGDTLKSVVENTGATARNEIISQLVGVAMAAATKAFIT